MAEAEAWCQGGDPAEESGCAVGGAGRLPELSGEGGDAVPQSPGQHPYFHLKNV